MQEARTRPSFLPRICYRSLKASAGRHGEKREHSTKVALPSRTCRIGTDVLYDLSPLSCILMGALRPGEFMCLRLSFAIPPLSVPTIATTQASMCIWLVLILFTRSRWHAIILPRQGRKWLQVHCQRTQSGSGVGRIICPEFLQTIDLTLVPLSEAY